MIDVNRKKIVLAILFSLLLISSIVGIFYYFQYNERKIFQRQVKQAINAYASTPANNADFKKMADELGALLKDSDVNSLNLRELGQLKIDYADTLSEIDQIEAHLILKELAADSRYPNDVRYRAINFIINDYEMAPDYKYVRKYIFT